MRSIPRSFTMALAVGAVVSAAACDGPQGLEGEDLIQAAPNLTAEGLMDGLELGPEREGQVKRKVEALHGIMLDAHELHVAAEVDEATKDKIHAAMTEVHEAHEVLMRSLTPAQRARFAENAHKLMAEGADDGAATTHENMRLHEARGGQGHPGH